MPTNGSITKTVRINPSDLAVLEEIMQDGLSWSGAVHKVISEYGSPKKGEKSVGTPLSDVPESVHRDNAAMALFGQMTYSEMIVLLNTELNDGRLRIESGEIVGQNSLDLNEFYDVCHEKNIRPEDAIKKCIAMLWRS